jgi:hypothetical protein
MVRSSRVTKGFSVARGGSSQNYSPRATPFALTDPLTRAIYSRTFWSRGPIFRRQICRYLRLACPTNSAWWVFITLSRRTSIDMVEDCPAESFKGMSGGYYADVEAVC